MTAQEQRRQEEHGDERTSSLTAEHFGIMQFHGLLFSVRQMVGQHVIVVVRIHILVFW